MTAMKRILCLLLCAAVLGCMGCGAAYTSDAFGFFADCPSGWDVEEDAASVCFSAPMKNADDDFFENVIYSGGIALADIEGGTLDAFVGLIVEGLAANSTDFTELGREKSSIAGMDAIVLTYTCTSSQTAYLIKQRMYILCDGESVHNIVYTANSETFDTYEAAAASIAESFQVK